MQKNPPSQSSVQALQVLYEDNHLIAVNKPAGVLVQGDISGDLTLMDVTRDYIRKKYGKPGRVFLGLLHRLDRPVAGVVLFAKTSKGASRVSEELRSRKVMKIYWALVHGKVHPEQGTLSSYLKKVEGGVQMTEKDDPDAREAILSYKTMRVKENKSFLEISLKTGRKHQIRAQLSAMGFPIEGDVKYGAPYRLSGKTIRLLAKSLTLKNPTRDEKITIEAPDPDWVAAFPHPPSH
jgi:23S rRNA pseudouridine1911/1915/1917 synthase